MILSHQEDVGQYAVLEGGVRQGVNGRDGAGRYSWVRLKHY